MAKLGSLPDSLRQQYQWQCRACGTVFKHAGAGLRCTNCGGSVRKVTGPELELIKWEMEIGD
jgi:rRNA maturation endonuclease Nob1